MKVSDKMVVKLFNVAIDAIFKNWSALQLAVENVNIITALLNFSPHKLNKNVLAIVINACSEWNLIVTFE